MLDIPSYGKLASSGVPSTPTSTNLHLNMILMTAENGDGSLWDTSGTILMIHCTRHSSVPVVMSTTGGPGPAVGYNKNKFGDK